MTDPDATLIEDYEDVSVYGLEEDDEAELLRLQNECTFIWVNREGWPVGVTMSYLHRDGCFWLTAVRPRKRIAAVERDPRVAVVVSSSGSPVRGSRTVTYKGTCTVHEDEATKAWFYPALAAALRPDPEAARQFTRFLDSPKRVVLQVVPEQRIGFDGRKMGAATARAIARQG
jgi:nitroimidazol reductase NimA-like FMN-containing flavoprotein (pyridoxamine 5'-phosphate oxidase superfamily)